MSFCFGFTTGVDYPLWGPTNPYSHGKVLPRGEGGDKALPLKVTPFTGIEHEPLVNDGGVLITPPQVTTFGGKLESSKLSAPL